MTQVRGHHWLFAIALALAFHAAALVTLNASPLGRSSPDLSNTGMSAIRISLGLAATPAASVPHPSGTLPDIEPTTQSFAPRATSELVVTDTPRLEDTRSDILPAQVTPLLTEETEIKSSNTINPLAAEPSDTNSDTNMEASFQSDATSDANHVAHTSHTADPAAHDMDPRTGRADDRESIEISRIAPNEHAVARSSDAASAKANVAPVSGDPSTDYSSANPTASTRSDAMTEYLELIRARLAQLHRYPKLARRRNQQGTAALRFVVNRQGQIVSNKVVTSSGHRLLDAEALKLIERASPLPPLPDEVRRFTLEVNMPVAYRLAPPNRSP